MIHRFSVRSTANPEPDVSRQRTALGLSDLEMWNDYYIEFERPLSAPELESPCAVLSEPPGLTATVDAPHDSHSIAVLHRRGVVDNESSSIVTMCGYLGLPARAGKVARNYRSTSPDLRQVIEERCFNSAVEELHDTPPTLTTLVPVGTDLPAEHHDLRAMSDEQLSVLGKADGRIAAKNAPGRMAPGRLGCSEAVGRGGVEPPTFRRAA